MLIECGFFDRHCNLSQRGARGRGVRLCHLAATILLVVSLAAIEASAQTPTDAGQPPAAGAEATDSGQPPEPPPMLLKVSPGVTISATLGQVEAKLTVEEPAPPFYEIQAVDLEGTHLDTIVQDEPFRLVATSREEPKDEPIAVFPRPDGQKYRVRLSSEDLDSIIWHSGLLYVRSAGFEEFHEFSGLFDDRFVPGELLKTRTTEWQERMRDSIDFVGREFSGTWLISEGEEGSKKRVGKAFVTGDGGLALVRLDRGDGVARYRSVELWGAPGPPSPIMDIRADMSAGEDSGDYPPPLRPPLPKGDFLYIPEGKTVLSVEVGKDKAEIPVELYEPPSERVRISLRGSAEKGFHALWREEQPDGTFGETIDQTWTQAVDAEVIVVEDQGNRGRKSTTYYPFGPHADRGSSTHRTLYVFGNRLPTKADDEIVVESETPGLTYKPLLMANADPELKKAAVAKRARILSNLAGAPQPPSKAGTAPAADSASDADVQSEDDPDGLFLIAEFDATVPTGKQRFRLNGTELTWPLTFADSTGWAYFVDTPPPDGTPTGQVYANSTTHLDVRLDAPIPVKTLTFHLTLGGEGGKLLKAVTPTPPTIPPEEGSAESGEVVTLTPLTNPPEKGGIAPGLEGRVFRSPALHFFRSDQGAPAHRDEPDDLSYNLQELAVSPKDLKGGLPLTADLVKPDDVGLLLAGGSAILHESPADLPGKTWQQALDRAAECYSNVEAVPRADIGEVSRHILTELVPNKLMRAVNKAVNSIRTTISKVFFDGDFQKTRVDRGETQSVPLDLGHHAAALLIRDEFVRQSKPRVLAYNKIRTDPEKLREFIHQGEQSGGSSDPFWRSAGIVGNPQSKAARALALPFGTPPEEAEEKRALVIARLLDEFARKAAAAMRTAADIKVCKLDELLVVAGFRSELVVGAIIPRLMRQKFVDGHANWEPDPLARAYVRNLHILGEAIRSLDAYSEIDTALSAGVALVLVSGGTSALAGIEAIGGVAAASVSAGVAAVDVGLAAQGLWRYKTNEDYYEFAQGASLTAGQGILDTATELRGDPTLSKYMAYGGAALSVAGAGKALGGLRTARMAAQGEKIAARLGALDNASVAGLSKAERKMVDAYVDSLKVRQALEQARGPALDSLGGAARAAGEGKSLEALKLAGKGAGQAAWNWKRLAVSPGLTPAERELLQSATRSEGALGKALSAADEAERVLGRTLTPAEREAVEKAHTVGLGEAGKDGTPARVYNYTQPQLRQKTEILKGGDFDSADIRKLMESHVVGEKLPPGVEPPPLTKAGDVGPEEAPRTAATEPSAQATKADDELQRLADEVEEAGALTGRAEPEEWNWPGLPRRTRPPGISTPDGNQWGGSSSKAEQQIGAWVQSKEGREMPPLHGTSNVNLERIRNSGVLWQHGPDPQTRAGWSYPGYGIYRGGPGTETAIRIRPGSEGLIEFTDEGGQGLIQHFRRPDGTLTSDIPTEHLQYWDVGANGGKGGWRDFSVPPTPRPPPSGSSLPSARPDSTGRYNLDLDEAATPPPAAQSATIGTPRPAASTEAPTARTGTSGGAVQPRRVATAEPPPPRTPPAEAPSSANPGNAEPPLRMTPGAEPPQPGARTSSGGEAPSGQLAAKEGALQGSPGGEPPLPPPDGDGIPPKLPRSEAETVRTAAGSETQKNAPQGSLGEVTPPRAPAAEAAPPQPGRSEAETLRTNAGSEAPQLAERAPVTGEPTPRAPAPEVAPQPSYRRVTEARTRQPRSAQIRGGEPASEAMPPSSHGSEMQTNRLNPGPNAPRVATRAPATEEPQIGNRETATARSADETTQAALSSRQSRLSARPAPVDPNDPFATAVFPDGQAPFETRPAGFYDARSKRLIYKDAPVLGKELNRGGNAIVYETPDGSIVKMRRLENEYGHAEDTEVGRALLERGERPDGYYTTAKRKADPVVVTDAAGNRYLVTVEEDVRAISKDPLITSAKERFANRPPNDAELATIQLAMRELNRRGLVWLDNKLANFDIVPDGASPTGYKMVITDSGGIVALEVSGGSANQRWLRARELQRQFDQVRHAKDLDIIIGEVSNSIDDRPFGNSYNDSMFYMGAPKKERVGEYKFKSPNYSLMDLSEADELELLLENLLGRKVPMPPKPGTKDFKPRRWRTSKGRRHLAHRAVRANHERRISSKPTSLTA